MLWRMNSAATPTIARTATTIRAIVVTFIFLDDAMTGFGAVSGVEPLTGGVPRGAASGVGELSSGLAVVSVDDAILMAGAGPSGVVPIEGVGSSAAVVIGVKVVSSGVLSKLVGDSVGDIFGADGPGVGTDGTGVGAPVGSGLGLVFCSSGFIVFSPLDLFF